MKTMNKTEMLQAYKDPLYCNSRGRGLKQHITNVLAMSLGHLEHPTRKLINGDSEIPGIAAYPVSPVMDDCFLYITDLDAAVAYKDTPKDLIQCLLYAADLECTAISFHNAKNLTSSVLLPVQTETDWSMRELNITGPVTEKMLTISTAHISTDTAKHLEHIWNQNGGYRCPDWSILSEKDGSGYIIAFQRINRNERWYDHQATSVIMKDLYQCMDLAASMGCSLLCLDSDGCIVPYLPVRKESIHG